MKTSGRTKSILMACGIALAVAVWMLSGIGNEPHTSAGRSAVRADGATGAADGNPERLTRVLIRRSVARRMTREIVVSARTEPNRQVELRAETDGTVVALGMRDRT